MTIYISIVIVILAVLLVKVTIKAVSQGSEYIIERFGKYNRTLYPGLNFIMPFIDKVANNVSMKETVLNIRKQEVISKDNASVQVDGIAFFQVLDSKNVTYVINNLPIALENLVITNIRTVMGAMALDEMLSNRETMNTKLLNVLNEATDPWGVKIVRVEIKDITPPADLLEAMGKQMKAEREKRANILTAEGIKQGAILKAEGEREAAILSAEGKKQSQILAAEAEKTKRILEAEGLKSAKFQEAEARERLAEAEAKATKVVSEAIKTGDIKAIQYFVSQSYVKALGELASSNNNKTLLMPLETTGVISSVASIAELFKDVTSNVEAKK